MLYDEIFNIEKDLTKEEIKKYIKDYIISLESKENFNKFINKLKNYYVYNITFKKFMEDNELPFRSKLELHNFIKNVLITEIETF